MATKTEKFKANAWFRVSDQITELDFTPDETLGINKPFFAHVEFNGNLRFGDGIKWLGAKPKTFKENVLHVVKLIQMSPDEVYAQVIGNDVTDSDFSDVASQVQDNKDTIESLSKVNEMQVFEQLPSSGQSGIVYLVKNDDSGSFDQYIWQETDGTGEFKFIGDTSVDISNYVSKSEFDSTIEVLATKEDIADKLTTTQGDIRYATKLSLNEFKDEVATTYATKDEVQHGGIDTSDFATKDDIASLALKDEVDEALEGKQDKLTAGDGISIQDGVISSTKKNTCATAEKLTDFLYEMRVDAIDYDYAKTYFETTEHPLDKGACSSIKAGSMFGRNFDWLYNNDDTYVVHLGGTATRHASLNVVGRITSDTDSKIIPFLAKDGINDAGLCVSINVVPHGDKGDNSVVNGGQTSVDPICTTMLPRFVLDNYSTATEAVDALKTMSFYHSDSMIKGGYEHHFLVADKDKSYIVEFVDGTVVVTEHPFMTNFHIAGTTFGEDGTVTTPATQTDGNTAVTVNHITSHGAGLERYNIIATGVSSANTVDAMRELLTSVKYTNTYKAETNPRWDSELVGIQNLTVDSPSADFDQVHNFVREQFNKRTRNDAPELQTWQTIHSSVYDMEKMSLSLVVQENDAVKFNFTLGATNISSAVTEEALATKLDKSTYEAEKVNFATKAEIADIDQSGEIASINEEIENLKTGKVDVSTLSSYETSDHAANTYATKVELESKLNTSVYDSEKANFATKDEIPALDDYAKSTDVASTYATKDEISDFITNEAVEGKLDTSVYESEKANFATKDEIPALDDYAKSADVASTYATKNQLTDYALKSEIGEGGVRSYSKYVVVGVYGQSNSVGYDETPLTKYDIPVDTNRVLQYSDSLKPLTFCAENLQNMNVVTSRVNMTDRGNDAYTVDGRTQYVKTKGIHLPLANLICSVIPDDYGVIIVPGSVGGLGVDSFKKGAGRPSASGYSVSSNIYDAFVGRLNSALALHQDNVFGGIIWCQGESNCGGNADTYISTLQGIITSIDTDIKSGNEKKMPSVSSPKEYWFAYEWPLYYKQRDTTNILAAQKALFGASNYIEIPDETPYNPTAYTSSIPQAHYAKDSFRKTIAPRVFAKMQAAGMFQSVEYNEAVTNGSSQQAVVGVEEFVSGTGTADDNYKTFILDPSLITGGELQYVSLKARATNTTGGYLVAFQRPEGNTNTDVSTWTKLGVSTQSVAGTSGTWCTWNFESIEIDGINPIGFRFVSDISSVVEGPEFGGRTLAREANTISEVKNASWTAQKTPEFKIGIKHDLTQKIKDLEEKVAELEASKDQELSAMNTLIEELMTRVNELSAYHDLDPVQPLPVWSTVTSDMFTQIYGSGSVLGDGRLTLGQNQTVLLPSDATHIRATPGAQVGSYRLLGMVLGVKPEGEPSEAGNMIAAFTYFNGNAVMRAHINNGTTIGLSETSGSNQYQPSGWSNNVNPIVNLLGQNTSTNAFELEKIDTYKIKVTNTTSGQSIELDVSSWPFFQNGGEIRFGFCGYNGNNSGMILEDIQVYK